MAFKPRPSCFMRKRLALLLTFLAILLILSAPVYVLEVRADGTETLLYQQPARLGDSFAVEWVHSVTKRPVIETYRLDNPGAIPIIQMEFDDFGPNLPARPEFDQKWLIADGKFIVTNYDLVFIRVPVTIGAVVANHTLIYNEKITPLQEVFRPGGYVHIGLAQKPRGKFIFEEVKIWQTRHNLKKF